MKNLVIVDTVGQVGLFHQQFKDRFNFVDEWHDHVPPGLVEASQHPHGGMALEKALLPLWDDPDDLAVHMLQIFDAAGYPIPDATLVDWMMSELEAIRQTGPTWVNNSWGAYVVSDPSPDRWKMRADNWRDLIDRGGIYVGWAAGNSGDYNVDEDRDFPQSLLTDISDKIGAADRSGKPSRYSGDSITAPPLGVYWATDVLLLNPNTGRGDVGSGTSFAAPKHVGLMCKRNIIDRAGVDAFKALAVRPASIPAAVIPHPKWGEGWLEDEYQLEIKDCPILQDAIDSSDLDMRLAAADTQWFDFNKASSYDYDTLGLKA